MPVDHGCVARMRAWGGVVAGCLALGCGGQGGEDDAAEDTTHESSGDPEGSSTDESGDACGAGCQPGGTVLWESTWGTAGVSNAAISVAVGESGRIAVAGYAGWLGGDSPFAGFVDVYDADGTPAFQAAVDQVQMAVAVASDDSVVVTNGANLQQVALRSYGADGVVKWDAVAASNELASGGPLAILPNGDIVGGGGTETAGLLTRFSSSGASLGFYPTPTNVYVLQLALLGDDVVALGDDYIGSFWLGRLTPSGTFAWSSTNPASVAKDVAIAPDGTVAVVVTGANGLGELQRFGADGERISLTALPRPEAVAESFLALDDGGFALAGRVNDIGDHGWVARLDDHFSIQWELSFAGEAMQSSFASIALAEDGSFVVAGNKSIADGSTDAWVLRVAP